MKNLAKKLTVLSKEEMNSIKGGMRWTNDRGGNVIDRRKLGGESMWSVMQRIKSYTALEILNGAY
ncbi:bacteriocin-type signal sequence-containing protein [Pedobacter suwonensis]|uniref:Bacteriocin-type signal sequence-containing protein n=1 Tax=Pedobacter suwonensis TaxID=332999 RepID=A0A1I0U3X8_9SPHI|nr:hypothetical protein [Pedobacter suwonensis]SFA58547.1 bacteriocin-type signal sequence-containing protein [Pedobacter suwonensis]